MTLSSSIKAAFETLIGGDHTSAGATYAALGSPTTQIGQALIISSTLNQSIFLSINGSDDHIFVPGGVSIFVNLAANKQGTAKLGLPKGTQFYAKEGPDGAPGSGDIYISVIYGR